MGDLLFETLGIALLTLRYGGLATIAFGAVLWGVSRNSTRKNKKGIWMIYTGSFMLIVYFGWSSFMALVRWLTDVSI